MKRLGCFCCMAFFIAVFAGNPGAAEVLYETDSLYYHIQVSEDGGYRYLSFDRTRGSQSAFNPKNPNELKFPYTRLMFLALAYLDKKPEQVLFLGLGGGSMPRILNKYLPDAVIDVVEIDPEVVNVAKKYFGFAEARNLMVHVQDGRQFLRRSKETYDAIFLDAYNSQSIPFHLSTREFFDIVKQHLSPRGVAASNVWSPSSNQYHYSHIKTLQQVFPQLHSFSAVTSGNYVFVTPAYSEKISKDELRERADKLLEQIRFPFRFEPFLGTYEDLTAKPVQADVLTDDFAPVDTLRERKAGKQ